MKGVILSSLVGVCLYGLLVRPGLAEVLWSAPTVLEADTGRYSSLEAGPEGTLHLAFYDYQQQDLRYAVRSAAGDWTFETVDSPGDVGWFASLELDADGVPHIAYCEFYDYKLKYAVRNGPDDWAIEVVDSEPGRGWYSSLALDSAGNPHIAYSGNREWDLRYTRYVPGSGWQFDVVDSAGDVGLYCALALDSSNLAQVSYFDQTNKSLKFARRQANGQWTTELVDGSGDVGIDITLALDDLERPHVAYWDRGNDALKYAHHDGAAWHDETVEAGTDCGYEASIRWLDGPRISYEGSPGVRYAEKTGDDWEIYQVDQTGLKCGDTALAFEGDDPRITYLNLGNGDLYYAEATAVIPEPTMSAMLLGMGLMALGWRRRR